jgi:hypothetical protein
VDRLDPGAQPGQAAADVHEAGGITGSADLGPGVQHVAHLVGQHRGRNVSVLDRERAAKAAAGVRRRQRHQIDAGYASQQTQRPVAHPQHPQRVTGGVVRDPVRVVCADVLDAEHVYQ